MKSKDKLYIISGICIVIALCFTAFFIYPTLSDVIRSSHKVLADKAQNILMQKELAELKAFKDNESQYTADVKRAGNLFVDAQNPVDFVEFIESIANQSNVSSDISLAPSPQGGPINFVIETKGSFTATANFSRRMETGSYLITVKKISMDKPEFSKDDPNYVPGQIRSSFAIEVVPKP